MLEIKGPLTLLAEHLLEQGKIVDAWARENDVLPASFDYESLVKLDLKSETARKNIVDAAQDLRRLALGPRDLLLEQYNQFNDLANLHYLYRHKIPHFVPADGAISYEDLALKLEQDVVLVRRMLRVAMMNRIFAETGDGLVKHSAASRLLCVEVDGLDSMGFFLEELTPAATRMVDALDKYKNSGEPNETGFNLAHNTSRSFYLELDSTPERARRFGAAMRWNTKGGRFNDEDLIRGYDWSPFDSEKGLAVDVGGGHGTVSVAIARATSSMNLIIQDLPATVSQGRQLLAPELRGRISFMEHDFFLEQPVKSADVYFLRFILHNWSDKYAAKILKNLVPALKDGARVILFEFLPGMRATTHWTEKQPLNMDMIQAIHCNSIERTTPDWRRLFSDVDPRLHLRDAYVPARSAIAIIEAEFRHADASFQSVPEVLTVKANGVKIEKSQNNGHKHSSEVTLIPTIDVASFLTDPTSIESQKVAEAVRNACKNTGFFQIVGHGLDRRTSDGVLQAAARFFALDYQQKLALDAKGVTGHRGYDVLASQSYHAGTSPDLKEGFFIGQDVPLDHPDVVAGRFFQGTNVWPDSLSIEEFRAPVEAYYNSVHSLSLRMLDLIAYSLGREARFFEQFTTGNTVAAMRLLHYPPATAEPSKQAIGAGAHTDFGAITLLLQDENAGLEVKDPHTGEYIEVAPEPGSLVFNIGDMLDVWTGGSYRSTVHRVINKAPRDRYSVAFFYDGALDCPLAPIDGTPINGKVLTVEQHLHNRHNASYGDDKVKAAIEQSINS